MSSSADKVQLPTIAQIQAFQRKYMDAPEKPTFEKTESDMDAVELPSIEQIVAYENGLLKKEKPAEPPKAEKPDEKPESVRLPTLEQLRTLHQKQALEKEDRQLPFIDEEEASRRESELTAAREEAGRLLQSAKREAAAIREQAEEDARQMAEDVISSAEQEKQAILEQGRQQGYEEGQQQALSELQLTLQTLDGQYKLAMHSLDEQGERLFEQVRANMVETIINIAEKVLCTEFDRNDEAFRNMIQTAIRNVDYKKKIVLKVSPWEYRRFFKNSQDMYAQLSGISKDIEIYEDAALAHAEFRVTAGTETLWAGISTQLARLGLIMSESGEE